MQRSVGLTKQIAAMSQSEMVELIMQLFNLDRNSEAFMKQRLGDLSGADEALERAKAAVRKQLWPDRRLPKLKLGEARKAISQFHKISRHAYAIPDLMLYQVELAVRCIRQYGDMHGEYYASMITMLQEVLGRSLVLGDFAVIDKLQARVKACAVDSSDIGWGFGDEMRHLYAQWVADLRETDEEGRLTSRTESRACSVKSMPSVRKALIIKTKLGFSK